MIIATLVEELSKRRKLWHLSEPIDYGEDEDEDGEYTTNYVITSIPANPEMIETFIFPCDERGVVLSWLELHGSFTGDYDHERAILNAGWQIESNKKEKEEIKLIIRLEDAE